MALDERYDPARNDFFRRMLENHGYNTTKITPRSLNRQDNGLEAGLVFPRDINNLILVLHPNMGTGVFEHKRETGENVTFLGPIVADVDKPASLAYKFQDDLTDLRNPKHDRVIKYARGEEFATIFLGQRGRFHGYHNLDEVNPVALRIVKSFT